MASADGMVKRNKGDPWRWVERWSIDPFSPLLPRTCPDTDRFSWQPIEPCQPIGVVTSVSTAQKWVPRWHHKAVQLLEASLI